MSIRLYSLRTIRNRRDGILILITLFGHTLPITWS